MNCRQPAIYPFHDYVHGDRRGHDVNAHDSNARSINARDRHVYAMNDCAHRANVHDLRRHANAHDHVGTHKCQLNLQ